jgi:hypothetical protein
VRENRQTYGRIAGVAVVGLLGCLLAGACSAGASGAPTSATSSPTPSAVALCHRTLTQQDLPAGIPTTRGAAQDCSDPNNADVAYVGDQTLAEVSEDLTLKPDAAQAAASFDDYVQLGASLALNTVKSDASPYHDLGDQVVYYYGHFEDTYWNYLFLRRGRLLMTVDITSYGATTPTQLRALVLKAISRYESPGQTL